MHFRDSIWITWERHRRSVELAKAFRADLYFLKESSLPFSHPIIRYIDLGIKTIRVLLINRPKVLFVQNPSIVLASLACFLRNVLKYKLVIDRHSNFKLNYINRKEVKWLVFHFLSKYSARNADLTIVTNDFLCKLVDSFKGNGYVLQDKLPEMNLGYIVRLDGDKNIVFISTFSDDEPIQELIEAAKLIDEKWFIYVTGRYNKYPGNTSLLNRLPDNVRLTGFLPEEKYQSLLMSSDLIVVLTTLEHTLTCGAYEGVALSKPLVVSDTYAIRNYFNKGVIYTRANPYEIANAIKKAIREREILENQIAELRQDIISNWATKFDKLSEIIMKKTNFQL